MYTQGMVFGVFDGLHKGHEFFLSEAMRQCEELTVVVTRSEVVVTLKGRLPKHSYDERVAVVRAYNPALKVVAGDRVLGEWEVLKRHAPDVIFLGYDQQGLHKELVSMNIPCVVVSAYHPETYKSGLLNSK